MEQEAMGTRLRQSHTELATHERQLYGPFQTGMHKYTDKSTSMSRSTDK